MSNLRPDLDRRVVAEYVETWDNSHNYAGFCVCQVVEEVGKPLRVERGKAVYLRDHPEARDWHELFVMAQRNLRSVAWWKKAEAKRKKAA